MIQINKLTDDIKTLKSAIEKIAREAASMSPVQGQEDEVYVATAPGTTLKEGQLVPYYDGANYRLYTKLNGTIVYCTLAP